MGEGEVTLQDNDEKENERGTWIGIGEWEGESEGCS